MLEKTNKEFLNEMNKVSSHDEEDEEEIVRARG